MGSGSASGESWYWSKQGSDERNGPVSQERLEELAEEGNLESEDLVWKEGIDDWMEARSAEELKDMFVSPPSLPKESEETTSAKDSLPASEFDNFRDPVAVAFSFLKQAVLLSSGKDPELEDIFPSLDFYSRKYPDELSREEKIDCFNIGAELTQEYRYSERFKLSKKAVKIINERLERHPVDEAHEKFEYHINVRDSESLTFIHIVEDEVTITFDSLENKKFNDFKNPVVVAFSFLKQAILELKEEYSEPEDILPYLDFYSRNYPDELSREEKINCSAGAGGLIAVYSSDELPAAIKKSIEIINERLKKHPVDGAHEKFKDDIGYVESWDWISIGEDEATATFDDTNTESTDEKEKVTATEEDEDPFWKRHPVWTGVIALFVLGVLADTPEEDGGGAAESTEVSECESKAGVYAGNYSAQTAAGLERGDVGFILGDDCSYKLSMDGSEMGSGKASPESSQSFELENGQIVRISNGTATMEGSGENYRATYRMQKVE